MHKRTVVASARLTLILFYLCIFNAVMVIMAKEPNNVRKEGLEFAICNESKC